MVREVVTSLDRIYELMPTWANQPFAFDVETSGLGYISDRVVGLALTFADGRSYYVVFEHTMEVAPAVYEQVKKRKKVGHTEQTVLLKNGNEKIKKTPLYEEWEETVCVEPQQVAIKHYIDRLEFANVCGWLLRQRDITMVAHNAKFDLHFLGHMGIEVEGRLADTMLAAQLLDENTDNGLKELAHLVGMELTEYSELVEYQGYTRREYLGVPLDSASKYAMMDTEATLKLWELYQTQLAEELLAHAFRDIWMPLLPVLRDMEEKGIALDIPFVKELKAKYTEIAEKHYLPVWHEGIKMVLAKAPNFDDGYLRTLDESDVVLEKPDGTFYIMQHGVELPVFRPTERSDFRTVYFNIASTTKHLPELLYKWSGLKPPADIKLKKTKQGEYSVDKDTIVVLDQILGDEAPPILKDLIAWRKANKFISTYIDVFLAKADPTDENCLRTTFNQQVAVTGRLTSTSPNLQNIPSRNEAGEEARKCFKAREGYSLIVADYSMMELRMIAHYSRDEEFMRAFTTGLDLHTLTGARQSRTTYEDLQRRIEEGDVEAKLARFIGKTSNFALSYGMGAKKFQLRLKVDNSVDVSVEEAKRLIDEFNSTYWGATEWKKRVIIKAKQLGYVQTISRRKRRLPDIRSSDFKLRMDAEREAINSIIQGSCADIVNQAIPAIQKGLQPFGGYVLLQVHDEIVCEVPTIYAQYCAKLVEQYMMGFINYKLRVPLTVDAHVGQTWGGAKG